MNALRTATIRDTVNIVDLGLVYGVDINDERCQGADDLDHRRLSSSRLLMHQVSDRG